MPRSIIEAWCLPKKRIIDKKISNISEYAYEYEKCVAEYPTFRKSEGIETPRRRQPPRLGQKRRTPPQRPP